MIAVSTTLSASEFTENAGITQSATNTKQSFRHRLFAPRTVVLDPAATLDTPDWLLFCTGIRSVDHAVENYCNAKASLATEALSLQGLRLLSRALPAIKKNPRRSGPAAGSADRHVAGDCAVGLRRADRREPRHRLRAGGDLRRAARSHLLRDAAGGAASGTRPSTVSARRRCPKRWVHRAGRRSELVKELIAGLDQPDDPARRRHQAREPRGDRAPGAGLSSRAGQSAAHQDGSGRDGDPRAGVVRRRWRSLKEARRDCHLPGRRSVAA